MSLASQAIELATKAAEARRDIYGEYVLIAGVPVLAAWGAMTNKKKVALGGFDPDIAAVCRVPSEINVLPETVVTRSGVGYIVDDVVSQPNSPEKVIRLRAK